MKKILLTLEVAVEVDPSYSTEERAEAMRDALESYLMDHKIHLSWEEEEIFFARPDKIAAPGVE